jgi:hypothetical protein
VVLRDGLVFCYGHLMMREKDVCYTFFMIVNAFQVGISFIIIVFMYILYYYSDRSFSINSMNDVFRSSSLIPYSQFIMACDAANQQE